MRLPELSAALREDLESSFPGTHFTVSTGYVGKDERRAIRGEVEWKNGPAVALVREIVASFGAAQIDGKWALVCLRWYTPEWAKAMAEHHGAHVKISVCGYNQAALIHPPSDTPEGEAALRRFRQTLDYCTAPTEAGRTKCQTN